MQLKRLEAQGFKSFADRISIDFDEGITAIVGPNGSGKSNITDAIRWVLGEQNVRNLRGLRAEDIIFTGSATRKPLNVAEVALTFEHDGELPLDFREITVRRRLFRSGDSEFFINNVRCRLKEIYNLFADTGIGHDGMSIIGQNRIDDILGAKPEERRVFFEETAGITKYKNRKRESMRKLDDSEANLVRITDLLRELERGLEPLSEQAAKTRRHEELSAEEKRCHITFLWQRCEKLTEETRENETKLNELIDGEAESVAAAKNAEAEQEILAKEVLELENELAEKGRANETIRRQMEANNVEMATLTERRESFDSNKERLRREREELKKAIEAGAGELDKLLEVAKEQRENLSLADELLAEERQKAHEYAEDIRRAKESADRLRRERDNARETLAAAEKDLAVQEQSILTVFGDEDTQEARLKEAETNAAARRTERDLRQKELSKIEAELGDLEQEIFDEKKRESELRQGMGQLERGMNELSQRIKSDETRLEMLNRMQESYEGFGKAVRAVLKSREPWRGGISGAVAELIKVPAAYVTAVEIALGGSLQNIVTEDTDTAKAAIEYLKRERLGRATFLPLTSVWVRPPEKTEAAREPGCLGFANTLVKTEPKYERVRDSLLGRTLVADNLDNALAIAGKYGYKLRIVTLAGELLTPGGAISGGSRSAKESGYLNREGEIDETRKRLEEAGAREAAYRESRARLSDELTNSGVRVYDLSERKQRLTVEQAEAKAKVAQGLAEEKAAEDALRDLTEQTRERRESYAAAQSKRAELKQAAAQAKKIADEKAKAAQGAGIALEELEQDADELARYINDRELKRAVLEQKLQYSEQTMLMRQKEQEGRQASLDKNLSEEADLEQDFSDTAARLTELKEENKRRAADYEAGQAEHGRILTARREKMAARETQEKAAKEIDQKVLALREQKHKLELIASKIGFALDECREKLLADYGLTPNRAAEVAIDIEPEELTPRLKKLQSELAKLGAVNPQAVEEYAALEKRCGFMRQQVDDLTKAKENLMDIIAQLDETMTKQFLEAFGRIQEYFADIFIRLFGGGKAELRLLDETDVLNTGVEILVQLPQKKRQNLSALSGGERALTVIALLFSFLRYRPSPFSVLDEIDAPLDEANVTRFGQFLREFAQNTQFIVVTHRKGTMEAVDTMYGVTIEDAGVSKILSVKIDKN